AAQQHRRCVAFRPAGLPLEMTVFHEMAAGRERFTVASAERHTAIAGVEHVAAHYPVICAAVDDHTQIAEVAQEATHDPIARTAADFDPAAARRFEHETSNG